MSISIQEMEERIKIMSDLRGKEKELSDAKKKVTEELERVEIALIETLNAEGLDNFRGSLGTISVTHKASAKLPRTKEDREAFFSYLKELGLYDDMVSVNSNTLVSFYNSKMEEAKQMGNVDFKIPGINEVKIRETLSFRRK